MNNRLIFLILTALLAFSMFIRMPFMSVALERDEGVRAAIAQGMLEEGKIPYRDFYTNKPPITLFIYILIFKIFGQTIESIHLFMYLYTLIGIVMIFFLAKMLSKNNVCAFVSAFSFSIMTISPRVFGNAANLEIFMILPIIISAMLLYKGFENRSIALFFFTGFFTGIAFWIKQSGIFILFFLIAFVLYEAFIRKAISIAYSLKSIFFILCGFIAMSLIICAYFWYHSILEDAMLWIFRMGLSYLDYPLRFALFWVRTKTIILENPILWLFAAVAFFHFLRKRSRVGGALVLWFAFSFWAVFPGSRFYPHYYIQIIPPLAILSGFGASHVLIWVRKVKPEILKISAGFIIVLLTLWIPFKHNYKFLFEYTLYQISKKIYGINPFPEALAVAKYIKKNTNRSDSILVFGDEPQVYFYSKRKSATKHIGFFFLVQNYPYESTMQRQAYWEIKESSPKYIVFFDVRYSLLYNSRTDKYIFDKLDDLIKNGYQTDGIVLTEGTKSTLYVGRGCTSVLKDKKGKPTVWIFKRRT